MDIKKEPKVKIGEQVYYRPSNRSDIQSGRVVRYEPHENDHYPEYEIAPDNNSGHTNMVGAERVYHPSELTYAQKEAVAKRQYYAAKERPISDTQKAKVRLNVIGDPESEHKTEVIDPSGKKRSQYFHYDGYAEGTTAKEIHDLLIFLGHDVVVHQMKETITHDDYKSTNDLSLTEDDLSFAIPTSGLQTIE